MATTETSFERLGIRTGLVTGLALIAYFLLMRVFNLIHVTELRYFNFVILFAALLYAYRHFGRSDRNIPYLPGLGLGLVTTAVSTALMSGFFYIYLGHIQPGFLEVLQNSNIWFADYLTPLSLAGVIMMEGLSSGLIISFTMMQYYKSRAQKVSHEMS